MRLAVRIRRDRDASIGIASPHVAGEIIFLPKSQIEIVEHDPISGRAIIECSEQLAIEKGIEALAEEGQ